MLINGYAATKDDWDPTFLDALSVNGWVICPDNRGMGASPPVGDALSVASMADDVVGLMDELAVARADLIGWSMGGFVAQEVSARFPERVRRLVLLATDPGGETAVSADASTWARLTDHSGTPREQATRIIQLLFPPEFARVVDAEFGDLVAAARASLSPGSLDAQEQAIDRWHAEPADRRLAAIHAPTLIAAGTEDVVIPSINSRRLADALPGSRCELIQGGGHAVMAQEPQRLAGLINSWLGR